MAISRTVLDRLRVGNIAAFKIGIVGGVLDAGSGRLKDVVSLDGTQLRVEPGRRRFDFNAVFFETFFEGRYRNGRFDGGDAGVGFSPLIQGALGQVPRVTFDVKFGIGLVFESEITVPNPLYERDD